MRDRGDEGEHGTPKERRRDSARDRPSLVSWSSVYRCASEHGRVRDEAKVYKSVSKRETERGEDNIS